MSSAHSARYRQFTERLKAARMEAEMDQLEVAGALGKYATYVHKCEAGERRVDVVELEEFADLYGKPLDYFLPSRGR